MTTKSKEQEAPEPEVQPKSEQGAGKSWEELEQKLQGGNKAFVKLENGVMHELKFLNDSMTERPFTTLDGRELMSYDFEVEENGQKAIFSVTSKKLLRDLANMRKARGGSLEGAVLAIVRSGSGFQTSYTVILRGPEW